MRSTVGACWSGWSGPAVEYAQAADVVSQRYWLAATAAENAAQACTSARTRNAAISQFTVTTRTPLHATKLPLRV